MALLDSLESAETKHRIKHIIPRDKGKLYTYYGIQTNCSYFRLRKKKICNKLINSHIVFLLWVYSYTTSFAQKAFQTICIFFVADLCFYSKKAAKLQD